MLDIKFIREHPGEVKEGARLKGIQVDIDRLLAIDEERIGLLREIEGIRAEKNKISDDIKKGGIIDALREKSKSLDAREEELKPRLEELEKEFKSLMERVPNPPLPDVPFGKDGTENKVIKTWGEPRKFDFEAADHVTLGETLDLIDIERASKVSGSRFYYLKNEAVLLEFALARFAMERLMKKGFTPMWTPILVKEDVMWGGGFLPFGKEEIYHIEKDDLYLIGTSEQTLVSYHKDEILEEKDLPKKYAGFSPCHREEAGSYGKDTRGILRVHHFDKVEMVVYAKPEDSSEIHDELLANEEEIMQALGIPYQVVSICSGDLGAPAAKKYDIEAWMPGQGAYRETHSTSNCTDFQARRLKVRCRREDGSIEYVHILNGTAIAIGRTLIAILENFQEKDGSVKIPDALVPYLGSDTIARK